MNYQNLFNRDFYTTPREVIERMTYGENLADAVVLEPSAGSGNIVRYCQEMGARYVLACEVNDTLRDSLYNMCNVIAPDFLQLTADRISQVSHIIMNPPFSSVERHINHAFDIAPAGCTIISLCPSSRFVHPYGGAKLMAERVALYGVSEKLGNCFNHGTADRATDADITLVKLYKPGEGETEFDGFVFDTTPEEISDPSSAAPGLVTYNSVRDMVHRYISALRQFDEVQRLSEQINADVSSFSSCSIRFGAHGKDHTGNSMSNITRDRFRLELQHAAWRWVFDELNMQRYTTRVLEEKINRFVESSQAMPFTMKNIFQVVNIIGQNIGNIMNECVVRAFDTICELSADNTTAGEKWKTNSNYMVNQRFIVDYIFTEKSYSSHLSASWCCSRRLDEIEDLYKALCFVACKPIDENNRRAFTLNVIEHCENHGVWYSFDWFRVRFYKKGTMHFEFTDPAVWYRFNQIAATAKGFCIGSCEQAKRRAWRDVK